ncbi:serine/threonine-protein kinase [Petrachloros mirabilis]
MNWALPYLIGITLSTLAGLAISNMAWADSFGIPLTPLTGPNALRLIAHFIALGLVIALAIKAKQELSEDDRTSGFLLTILFPLTALIVILFGGKSIRTSGFPVIQQIGPSKFLWAYAFALVGSGLWLTTSWLRHLDMLRNSFSPLPTARPPNLSRKVLRESDQGETGEKASAQQIENTSESIANGKRPTSLGRYKILKELGRGAMGLVYLGKDPTIQRFVAIKTMRLDEIADEDKLQEVKTRFFREAESAGRLSHPNIVTIYDAGEQGDLGYIAMEFIEGKSLKEYSRKPNLMPITDVVQTVATVADALDYAHQQGVIHRDIKPANIMMTNDRLVKVMDFGIAKLASSSKTQTDVVLGTPTYMSPEQIAGKKVDGRSDVFSLGIVLFELLTGQPPFTADNLSALLFAIAHHPHPELERLRPDLPPKFREVLDRALQKDLPQRYRRAGEFAHDLRACIRNLAA